MSKKLKKAFGLGLRDIRKKHGLSQLKVSSLSGLDRTYMSDLERGTKYPSLNTLFRLAKAMGISPVELIKKTLEYLE